MPTKRIPLPMFRTILVAADYSARSREAFNVACSLAREGATRLIVLLVLEPPDGAIESSEAGVFATGEGEAEGDPLSVLLHEHYIPDHPISVEYLIREGNAPDVILQVADEERCDLIVMGTHGRRGLDRLLTGSVAEAVLRKAHCPVLTVRSALPDHAHTSYAVGCQMDS